MNRLMRTLLPACAALALLLGGQQLVAAPPAKVVVQSATPSTGEQGTIDLDVTITGSGFDETAAVTFLVSGSTTDTGGVTVRSVEYVNSTTLRAKVNLQNAKIADFDVMVRLSSGRNGKGTTLFKVVSKGNGTEVDSTPPASIDDIQVKTSGLALTLRFVATGDDGTSGTATHYDVFYRSGSSCADVDNPGSNPDQSSEWTRALRSAETAPLAAGSLEFFNVRPLDAGQAYCLAIRAGDEVPQWSDWRVVGGTTEPGWEIANTWPIEPFSALADKVGLVTNEGMPVVGWWQEAEHTAVFAGTDWRVSVPVNGPSTSWLLKGFRFATYPGSSTTAPAIGAVLTQPYQVYKSSKGKNGYYITGYKVQFIDVIEGTATISDVANGAEEAGGLLFPTFEGSTVSFLQSGSAWNPAVTLERIVQKDSSMMRTNLVVAERIGGVWSETSVLSRQDAPAGRFFEPVVATKPDGATLVVVSSHCSIMVYAERSGTGDWSYWAANTVLTNPRVAFDSAGQVMVFGQKPGYGTPGPVLLRGDDFAALSDAPAASCTDVSTPTGAGAGEVVSVAPDPDLNWTFVSGVASVEGATFLSLADMDGNKVSAEQRVLYQCGRGEAWQLLRADRTHGGAKSEVVLGSDGSLLKVHEWDRFSRHVSLPSYWSPPDTFVYLARHMVNPCGVSPSP